MDPTWYKGGLTVDFVSNLNCSEKSLVKGRGPEFPVNGGRGTGYLFAGTPNILVHR